MKKLFALLLSLAMLTAVLAACGGTDTPSTGGDGGAPASTAPAGTGSQAETPDTLPPLPEFNDEELQAKRAGLTPPEVDRGIDMTVLTGPSTGIYFPIGAAFANYLGELGYRTSAPVTGATAENINAILGGEGEMAIAMADSVIQCVEGFGAYEAEGPNGDLRAMMGLWPNYCQIVTTKDSGITKFEDLKGKRVGVGAPNSGVELNARMMFEAHGMTYDDCTVDYLPYGEAITQMKNGQCDVAFVTSGLGNATILELAETGGGIKFVPVEGQALQNLLMKYPFYIESTIPADVYGTDEDTTTAAVMNIMLVSKDIPDDVVYDMLYNIYSPEGLAAIGGSHDTAGSNILLSTGLRGIYGTSVELHSGAKQFYLDMGMLPA